MARAATKTELIKSANEQFEKMWAVIDVMSEDERNAAFCFGEAFSCKEAHWHRDKNLRDVLVHLYEWHKLLLNWVDANTKGEAKPFIPAPYNWKSYGQMNVGFFGKHQQTPFDRSAELVKDSHMRVIKMIAGFSDDELFSKGVFSWTGTSTLGSYCVSATASHYDWAMKKIKTHDKTYNENQKN